MGDIDRITKELISFSKKNNSIYIYGAGKYAKYAFLSCKELNIKVTGFITTKYEKEAYCGLPVVVADQVQGLNDNTIGIVPGFAKCSACVCDKINGNVKYFGEDPSYFKIFCKKLIIRKISNSFPGGRLEENSNEKIKKILVVRMDAIGDLICTTPLLRALRKSYVDAEISVVIQKGNRAVLNYNPYIDRIYEYDGDIYDDETDVDLDGIIDVVNSAKEFVTDNKISNDYQIVIMPMHFMEGRNALLTVAVSKAVCSGTIISWVKTDDKINMFRKEIAEELPCKIVTVTEPMHEKDYVLSTLRVLNIMGASSELQLFCKKEDSYIDSIINDKKDDKFIAVGVVGSIDRKTWKSENYKELFASLSNTKVTFVIFGASDAIHASEIIGEGSNIINLVNKTTLEQTLYAVGKCDMYVGSNTGLLHMAVALNKPCVTLYAASKEASPWDGMGPVRWGAQGVRHIDLLPDHCIDECAISCSKNYSHCINQITVKEVGDAICSLL